MKHWYAMADRHTSTKAAPSLCPMAMNSLPIYVQPQLPEPSPVGLPISACDLKSYMSMPLHLKVCNGSPLTATARPSLLHWTLAALWPFHFLEMNLPAARLVAQDAF